MLPNDDPYSEWDNIPRYGDTYPSIYSQRCSWLRALASEAGFPLPTGRATDFAEDGCHEELATYAKRKHKSWENSCFSSTEFAVLIESSVS